MLDALFRSVLVTASSERYTERLAMNTIHVLDVNWVGRPRSIAAALLQSNGHAALIDPGPESSLPELRKQLAAHALSVADLKTILLTHIHLDHAGASGALVRENPRLMVYVHELGFKHMADPSKLLASAARLWPNDLHELFGDTLAVPADNLRVLRGGETLQLGGRKVEVVYTPGHASHHVSYFDDAEGVAFVGDTAGVRIEDGPYILPATPPPDIDLGVWQESFAAILGRRPQRLFLTHFGYSDNPEGHIAEFRERLHAWGQWAAEALRTEPTDGAAQERFISSSRAEMEHRLGAAEAEHHAFTARLDLSFLGLARYWRKRAEASA